MLDEGRPLFVQIAEQIENDILDGTYPEETAVPSTNALAAFLRINPATAGKGLNRLVDTGILYKRRGIGMFVASGAKRQLMESRKTSFAMEYVAPLVHEASKLGLSTDDLIALITKEAQS
ncbi:GntR family transcriptional regulator [Paramicrobacterium fandaimingii]|uniref:GntR family transcriptional regulator n=1 Tax=Paramicrobacterium fandaimingii TaxID=2708079 RepID=UPI0014201531|nr:GntR family transcriptional regulator [Microbacterium fandaimingii]